MKDEPRHEDIGRWIVDAALAGCDEIAILTCLCERMSAAGIAIVRASVAHALLDPTYSARGVRWVRGEGGIDEPFIRRDDDDDDGDYLSSPFAWLVESNRTVLRRRLDATHRRDEMPLLDRFQDEGMTEYVAFAAYVGEGMRLGEGRGIVVSYTTDTPAGFTDGQVALLATAMPALTLAFLMRTTLRTARTLLTTYLGTDAAERVLAGNIVRGRAEPIRAVVWFSDLVGFTRIADTVSAETMLALLNEYAEAQVEEIEAQGGHVLKFIGDGLLAIFPQPDTGEACRSALAAAMRHRERVAVINARRSGAGLPVTDAHVALHVGELLYGNLGSPRRLDFTVLGPAVNEASRIEALCASLDQAVIVSSAFAEAAGDSRALLVSLGRYAMKGVARPQELYTLEPE
jgi:adenylate cyclase